VEILVGSGLAKDWSCSLTLNIVEQRKSVILSLRKIDPGTKSRLTQHWALRPKINGQEKMKIIGKPIILLLLAVFLTACNSFTSTPALTLPTTNPTGVMETAISIVETKAVMTQAAIPTTNFPPPTNTPPPGDYPDGLVRPPPADQLDYAMATAAKVYNRLPHIAEKGPYGGQYSGCANTNDFSTAIYYAIGYPLDTVTSAFDRYFQEEKWGFTEATTELVGSEIKVPEVSYDVYRVLTHGTSAFQRLQIAMRDESVFRGTAHIDVRLFLTHIETKSNLEGFGDFFCGLNNQWLWTHLHQ